MQVPEKYPEILVEFCGLILPILTVEGIANDKAEAITLAITDAIKSNFGGSLLYIGKGRDMELTERDMALWAEYNGKNKDELLRKYDISEVWFYKIIKRAKRLDIKKRQVDLFGDT